MESMNIVAKEMQPEELEKGLSVRNRIFAPITADDWHRDRYAKTASIAFNGDTTVGFIPLSIREIKLVPGVTVRAAFENAVGTDESCRGQGVGGRMIEAACKFLPGKADALFVYRGNERSDGYRFYTKTGHSDLHYTRLMTCKHAEVPVEVHEPAAGDRVVSVSIGTEQLLNRQELLLGLFEETYASFGGFPQRHADFWTQALDSTIYAAHKTDFVYFELQEEKAGGTQPTGYAIAGRRQRKNEWETLTLLEIATAEGCKERGRELLKAVCRHSRQSGYANTQVYVGTAHPYAELLPELGFKEQKRSLNVMAHLFDPRALFDRLWRERVQLQGVKLVAWTPLREVTLLDGGPAPERTVTLEMKEDMLTSWLLGRLDLKSRLREGSVTIMNASEQIIEELARAIPHADWVYHHLDYI